MGGLGALQRVQLRPPCCTGAHGEESPCGTEICAALQRTGTGLVPAAGGFLHPSEASRGFGDGGKAGFACDALLVPRNGFVVCIPPAKKGFGM